MKESEGKALEECVSNLLIHSGLQTESDVPTRLTAHTVMRGHQPSQSQFAHLWAGLSFLILADFPLRSCANRQHMLTATHTVDDVR